MAGERVTKSKTWPDNPQALSGRLRRAATFLRKIGIEITFEREGRARTRIIRIGSTEPPRPEIEGTPPSTPSAPSAGVQKVKPSNDVSSPSSRTVVDDTDGTVGSTGLSVRANSLKTHGETDADDADANFSHHSGPERSHAARSVPGATTGKSGFEQRECRIEADARAADEVPDLPAFLDRRDGRT